MNVEKIIRILGYIVYTMLWSPIIIIGGVLIPIGYTAWGLHCGLSLTNIWKNLCGFAKIAYLHDRAFIRTGRW